MSHHLLPVRTELVEVPSFFLAVKGQGFDKLSPNGVLGQ